MDTGNGPNAQTMPMKEGAQSMFALLQNLILCFWQGNHTLTTTPNPSAPIKSGIKQEFTIWLVE